MTRRNERKQMKNKIKSNNIFNLFAQANDSGNFKKIKKLTKKYEWFVCSKYNPNCEFDKISLPESFTSIEWKTESLKAMIKVCPTLAFAENAYNANFVGGLIQKGNVDNVKTVLDTCPFIVTGRTNKKEMNK